MPIPSPRCRVLLAAVLIAVAAPAGAGELDRLLDEAASALHAGDDARARVLLERASAVDDADPEVLLALARLELRRGDLAAAEATVRRVLARAPDHAAALAQIGRAHV
jgi:Tfp pilus assembly protein PilF